MVLDGGRRYGRAVWRVHDLLARVARRVAESRHFELPDLVDLFGLVQCALGLLPALDSVGCVSSAYAPGPTFDSGGVER